ncbi:autotransporter-associated beta strand repeat-containing protein [Candidatus Pelagibacter sp.]|nr:autotransporter-associated beta strand repeat-containing protein [Candidatus Pelagibacter sp.]
MGISKKLKMIKNNEYLIFKMQNKLFSILKVFIFICLINLKISNVYSEITVDAGSSQSFLRDIKGSNDNIIVEDGGTIEVDVGSVSNTITIEGNGGDGFVGSIVISTASTLSGKITLTNDSTIVSNKATIFDVSSGDAIDGSGTLTLNSSAGSMTIEDNINLSSGDLKKINVNDVTLKGVNSYTGQTIITNSGSLNVLGSLPDSTNVAVGSGGTYNVNASDTIGSISGAGTISTSTTGTKTLTVGGNGNSTTFDGAITNGSGTLNLVKEGNGTLTLDTVSKSMSGTLDINDGVIAITSSSGIDSDTVEVNTGATLELRDKDFTSTGRIISISGSGHNSLGALYLSSDGSDGAFNNSSIILNDDATISAATGTTFTLRDIDDAPDDNIVVYQQTGENNNLTLSGGGTIIFEDQLSLGTGSLTISAGTTLNTGIANMISDNSAVIISGTYNMLSDSYDDTINSLSGSGTINLGSKSTLTVGNNSSSTEFSGTIDDASVGDNGSIIKTGSASLTLSGTNTYSGSTTINAGTISVASSANLGATPGSADVDNIIFNGGTLNTTADFTLGANKGITMTGAGTIDTDTGTTLTFAGSITDSGTLTKTGAGTLSLTGTSDNSGGILVSAGKIEIGNNASLGTGTITLNGGTLSSDSTTARTLDEAIAISSSSVLGDATNTGKITLSGSSTFSGTNTLTANSDIELSGSVDLGSATQTFSVASGKSTTLSGAISSGAISKSGDGTLIISADNDYASGTTVSAGTLRVSGSGDLGTGSLTIGASGTLDLRNTLAVASLEISGAGSGNRITNGDADGTTANLTVSGTSTLNGAVNTDGTQTYSGTTTLGSDVSLSGSTVSLAAISGGTNALAISGNLDLSGAASSLNTLSVSGTSDIGADVTTTGSQTYTGATTFSASSTLTGSNVNFGSTVDGGNNNIIISGNADIDGAITNTAALSVQGVGSTSNIGADITTAGVQFLGNATLSGTGDRTVTSTGGSDITFYGITGASKGLTVDGGFQLSTNDATGLASLSVTGASTLAADVTSTGTQSYDGTTTLSSGDRTLTASTVTLNAVTGRSNALTITGNLDLDGAVSGLTNMSVSGTSNIGADVTTTGTQSYTGTTTVSASSTLNGTEITAAAAVLNNNLNITNSSSSSFTGAISGTGNLTKAGSGTLTLSGTNSYTGDTTISAGTLTVSGTLSNSTTVSVASGAIYDVDATDTIASVDGAGTVDIASSTTLTTGDTNDQELSGTVSGAGSLTKAGSGILTLSGTNSYSGNTNISAGILLVTSQLGEGTYAGNISNSGVFGINSSSNQTLSGIISGSGTINKSGTGELTLTGANTYNGTINVAGGTLFAGSSSDGSNYITLGNVNVKGGTLGGGGKIRGNISFTETGGTLAPGNSIGTLTVSGDLTLSADDTTEIEFNASSADKIVVNGNTILAGTISLFPENTTYSDVSLTIVDGSRGGTFSGTFATETMNNQSNLNGATWDIVYNTVEKTVKLDLTEAETSSNLIKDTTTVNKFKDVATVFDNATTGQLKEIKDVLNSATVNSVNTELGKLKGTVLASTFTQPTLNHNNFNRALTSVTSSNINTSLVSSFTSNSNELTLASLQDAGLYGDKKNFNEYFDYSDTSILGFVKNNKNRSIFNDFQSEDSATFIRTYGTTVDRDNINSNYTGYDSETTGILFGQQFKNDEETFTGYSYGFTGTDTDYKNNYGESKTYSVHASLFKQYDKKDHGLNLISGMYVSKTESERNVSVFGTSVNDKYVSDYWDVGINQEVQYIKKYKFGEVSVSPSAKLNSTYVFKSDTEETGGELALNVDNDNLFLVKPELGISIGVDLSKKDNINNELSLAMFASQDHFIDGTTSNARYSSGSSFNVDLPRDQETYYSLGLGYNFLNKETDTSLMANAFLMQNEESDMNSNIFSLTFRKLFGDFAKGNVPPVIAKKPDNDQEVIKEASPKDKNTIKKVEKTLEEFEENIEIVLKESPTEQEVAKVYESVSNNSKIKRQLTLNDVYNNLSANCYAIENKLVHLVNYYDKQQLYKILDKCNKLSDPKIHLIANRLHQIQLDETTAYQKIYFKYLRILSYLPFVTFVAFIILAYEFIRRYIVNHFRAKNTV